MALTAEEAKRRAASFLAAAWEETDSSPMDLINCVVAERQGSQAARQRLLAVLSRAQSIARARSAVVDLTTPSWGYVARILEARTKCPKVVDSLKQVG